MQSKLSFTPSAPGSAKAAALGGGKPTDAPVPSPPPSPVAACPLCGLELPPPALLAHTNACLDALSIPSPPPSPSPSQSPSRTAADVGTDATGREEKKKGNENSDSNTENSAANADPAAATTVAAWLAPVGLAKYAPHLLRAGFRSLRDLLARPPDDAALRAACGVTALGARRKLLDALATAARAYPPDNGAPPGRAPAAPVVGAGAAGGQPKTAAAAPPRAAPPAKRRKLWAIFEPGYVAPAATAPAATNAPFGAPAPAPAAGAARRPRQQLNAAPGSASGSASSARRSGSPAAAANASAAAAASGSGPQQQRRQRKHAVSHRVAGTSFTVDSFHAARSDPGCTRFFLTHFHSDHYGGLRRTVLPPGARVLCSAVTASLVHSQLRVPREFLQELPLGKRVDVPETPSNSSPGAVASMFRAAAPATTANAGRGGGGGGAGASVWAFDANHCPGAVVLLFRVWRTGRWILHTGDCRFEHEHFARHRELAAVIAAGKLDVLHLDTTYCDARYAFPPQADVLRGVVAAARREDARTRQRCLFFFGTYSIGKERVFLAVAEALNLNIFASPRKRALLSQLGFGARVQQRLTDRPGDARVHVVAMRELSADGLRRYAANNGLRKDFIGRGLAIVFRPTGWAFQQAGGGGGRGARGGNAISNSCDTNVFTSGASGEPQSGGSSSTPLVADGMVEVRGSTRAADHAMFYNVPYSEHSSFEELRAFVRWAQPARLLPTVNVRSAADARRLCEALQHKDRPMRKVEDDDVGVDVR